MFIDCELAHNLSGCDRQVQAVGGEARVRPTTLTIKHIYQWPPLLSQEYKIIDGTKLLHIPDGECGSENSQLLDQDGINVP